MWDKDPVSFIDDVVLKDGSKLIKDIATDFNNALNDKSPVDTSRFVSNWNVSLDQEDTSYSESKKIGRGAARAQGASVIGGMKPKKLHTVYFTNVTPYGVYLNAGYSAQSPNGIVYPVFSAISMFYR